MNQGDNIIDFNTLGLINFLGWSTLHQRMQYFCFPCFIFENKVPRHLTFTTEGFRSWKRVNDRVRCAFLMHVGSPTSPHNNAVKSIEDLMKVSRHIDKVLNAQTIEEVQKNRLRLMTIIESVRWLSLQACAFRGHDESSASNN
jgi:hypothetical protein